MKTHKFQKEGYALVGAAFEVYNFMGFGLAEEIYQESLEIELELQGIPFESQYDLAVFYKGHRLRKTYVPDLVVHAQIVVELKAIKQIAPDHEAQLLNYMLISKSPVGYLLNFGTADKLEWKRFVI